MRFDRRTRVPSELISRHRRRLLGMTVVLGLVMVAAHMASNPQHWKWLTEMAAQKVARAPRKKPPLVNPMIEANDPLPDGAFRLMPTPEEPVPEPDAAAKDDKADAPEPPAVATNEKPAAVNEKPGSAGAASRSKAAPTFNLRIPPQWLKLVKDSTVGIRRDESPAYYEILAKVHEIPLNVLERAGRKDATFAGLFNDPEDYRGQLITLEGELRRFTQINAGPNDKQLEHLYEGWMFTEDGGRSNPFRIVCTEKPEGMSEGEQVRERVRFTGYFFKRCSYVTPHGLHSTPMLLGHRLRWIRPTHVTTNQHPYLALYVASGVALLGGAFASVLWWYSRSERQTHATQMQRVLEPGKDAFASLKNLRATDVNEELQRLAEAAAAADQAENS